MIFIGYILLFSLVCFATSNNSQSGAFDKLPSDSFAQQVRQLSFKEMALLVVSGGNQNTNLKDLREFLRLVKVFREKNSQFVFECIENQTFGSEKLNEFCFLDEAKSLIDMIKFGRQKGYIDTNTMVYIQTNSVEIAREVNDAVTPPAQIEFMFEINSNNVKQFRELERIKIERNFMMPAEMKEPTPSYSIESINKAKLLKISLGSQNMDDQNVTQLSQSIEKMTDLFYLDINLEKNQISDEGVEHLAASLKTMKKLEQLEISLSKNRLINDGVAHLFNAIKELENVKDLSVNLGSNQIGNLALNSLPKHLKDMKQLTQLTLGLSQTQVSTQGAEDLENDLKNLTQLNHLVIDHDGS